MAGDVPWILDGTLVYALDDGQEANRFNFNVYGGYTNYGASRKTSSQELDAVARLAHAAPEMAALLERHLRALESLDAAETAVCKETRALLSRIHGETHD